MESFLMWKGVDSVSTSADLPIFISTQIVWIGFCLFTGVVRLTFSSLLSTDNEILLEDNCLIKSSWKVY